MKRITIKNIVTIALKGLFIALVSCAQKSNDPAPTAPVPSGTVYFHLHNYISDSEVDGYGFVYQNGDGRKIALTKAQFYFSNFQFVKLDGSVYTVPDSVALKVQETDIYQIAKIPVGNYKSVRFNVGLDPATSAKSSSAYSNGVLNHSDMWYGSTAQPNGYIFLNLEGKIDTTSDLSATDAQLQPFSYKLGTSNFYKQVILPDKNFSITLNQTQYVHLIGDWNVLLSGINLNNPSNLSLTSSAGSSSAVATIIANNIANMFRYED